MRGPSHPLLNSPDIELWPGGLLRARRNADARLMARAHTVLRRKHDGAYLALMLPQGFFALVPGVQREPGIADARALLATQGTCAPRATGSGIADAGVPNLLRPHGQRPGLLPLQGLQTRLDRLGLDADGYARRTGLTPVHEPTWLAAAGRDRNRRPLWLHVDAARAWRHMQAGARRDGVVLDAISGYRSHAYQLGIVTRKRARGLGFDAILAVNAAPGFSEHHSGRALDIGTPGEPAAEDTFERTPAFAWLVANAAGHGFHLSYPRGNPHGIVYEPWHWCHRGSR